MSSAQDNNLPHKEIEDITFLKLIETARDGAAKEKARAAGVLEQMGIRIIFAEV